MSGIFVSGGGLKGDSNDCTDWPGWLGWRVLTYTEIAVEANSRGAISEIINELVSLTILCQNAWYAEGTNEDSDLMMPSFLRVDNSEERQIVGWVVGASNK